MSQSKDADGPAAVSLGGNGASEVQRRLELLLEERARLLGRVRGVDRMIAELRRDAGAALDAPGRPGEAVFAIRGAEAETGAFDPPPGIDVADLRECLAKVVLAARRGGARIESLELLIGFDPCRGRVRSVAARQPGQRAWVPQLRRSHDAPGSDESA